MTLSLRHFLIIALPLCALSPLVDLFENLRVGWMFNTSDLSVEVYHSFFYFFSALARALLPLGLFSALIVKQPSIFRKLSRLAHIGVMTTGALLFLALVFFAVFDFDFYWGVADMTGGPSDFIAEYGLKTLYYVGLAAVVVWLLSAKRKEAAE